MIYISNKGERFLASDTYPICPIISREFFLSTTSRDICKFRATALLHNVKDYIKISWTGIMIQIATKT